MSDTRTPDAWGGDTRAAGGADARRVTVSATGLLADFSRAGALAWGDLHPAQQLAHLFGESDQRVLLAIALTVRALRAGSICLEVDLLRDVELDEDAAPIPEEWWPPHVLTSIAQAGFMGITAPEKWGGAAQDLFTSSLVAQVFGKWNPAIALSWGASENLCMNNIFS